jgi:hypothetical protein
MPAHVLGCHRLALSSATSQINAPDASGKARSRPEPASDSEHHGWIAATFCVLVTAAMLYQHWSQRSAIRGSHRNYSRSRKTRASPTDESREAKSAGSIWISASYFRRLSLNHTGGWLLVGAWRDVDCRAK